MDPRYGKKMKDMLKTYIEGIEVDGRHTIPWNDKDWHESHGFITSSMNNTKNKDKKSKKDRNTPSTWRVKTMKDSRGKYIVKVTRDEDVIVPAFEIDAAMEGDPPKKTHPSNRTVINKLREIVDLPTIDSEDEDEDEDEGEGNAEGEDEGEVEEQLEAIQEEGYEVA